MKVRLIALLLVLLSPDFVLAQASFFEVQVAFPQIAIGGESGGQNYVTLIQIVNNNSARVTGQLALHSDSGSPLAALFDGQGPRSTSEIMLEAGETRQIRLTLDGVITTGWMIVSYSPSEALTSVILQFRSGTTLLSEVGVDPAFETIQATDFAAETDSALNTGIAVANPNPAPAYILASLWEPATGSETTRVVISLPPNGHIGRLLTEVFPEVPDISQTRAKISLDSCSDPSCSFAGEQGFLATVLRLNGDQLTTIGVAERAVDGEPARILPQVAFGGPATGLNMKTVLYLTTNVPSGVIGRADIFDDDGNPLNASANGAPASSSFDFTVLGNRVTRLVLTREEMPADDELLSGWLRLTSSSGSVHLVANAVFQTFIGSSLVSEAGVLESPPIERGLIYVKSNLGASVGVAFANSESSPNTITLELFNQAGFVFATHDIMLPANGHLAQFVTEIFPQLASVGEFDGALSVRSSTPFSALALRLSSDRLATLPVAANGMYRPSIIDLRISGAQTSPAQIRFQVDLRDFNSDIATASSTTVLAVALVDLGSTFDFGNVEMDGTAMRDRDTGTLSGTFQPNVTGIPSGLPATFYIFLYDSVGNESNFVGMPFTF